MPTRPTTRSGENLFTKRREPLHFLLWLGIVGSVLIFTVLLGIYIVRKVGPNWYETPLPGIFWFSTVVIILSSISLHEAKEAFQKERFALYRICLGITLFLGMAFVGMQGYGWLHMIEQGFHLRGNPSAGFVYLLTGLHVVHILGGLIFMGVLFREATKNQSYIDSFVYSVNPPNQLKIKLMTTYWHFVDVLWLYLFLFLLYHHTA
ncbi:cytochrome c oxidase subunit 3 [Salmonirosea aquatica]|uniref:Heme-copper oxidase subunit III n=1 Tax=Salmonirosea aquatica TaxID=2654236 RepID=A0A7C9BQ08_9BACT|nr:heme-copper oxidase subunit III [Cytophagaceae bacterium SJW1-29]